MIERSCRWLSQYADGQLLARSVVDKDRCFRGVSTDSRQIKPGQLFIPLVGEKFDGHEFLEVALEKGAVATLWQQSVPLPEKQTIPFIKVTDTLQAMEMIAAQYRQELAVPIVALTGSNGKTTTKDMLGAILRGKYRVHQTQGNLNNHIGVPLTLLAMPETTEIAVVEMGMNHEGEIAQLSLIAKPDLAVITNIGDAHIEFLGSREGITKAKLEIREGLATDGTLFVNGDEPLLHAALANENRPIVYVGWDGENADMPQCYELKGLAGVQFQSSQTGQQYQLPILGRHNVINALLAISVGRHLGISEEAMQEQLQTVKITGGRLEVQTAHNGMTVINDAYNASPTSVKAALLLYRDLDSQKEKWILLGDMLEMGEQEESYHRDVGAFAVQMGIKHIYTIGRRGRWIAAGANEHREKNVVYYIHHFENHDEAISHFRRVGNENVILLVKASLGAQLERVVDHIR